MAVLTVGGQKRKTHISSRACMWMEKNTMELRTLKKKIPGPWLKEMPDKKNFVDRYSLIFPSQLSTIEM